MIVLPEAVTQERPREGLKARCRDAAIREATWPDSCRSTRTRQHCLKAWAGLFLEGLARLLARQAARGPSPWAGQARSDEPSSRRTRQGNTRGALGHPVQRKTLTKPAVSVAGSLSSFGELTHTPATPTSSSGEDQQPSGRLPIWESTDGCSGDPTQFSEKWLGAARPRADKVAPDHLQTTGWRYRNPSNEWLAKFIQEELFTFGYERPWYAETARKLPLTGDPAPLRLQDAISFYRCPAAPGRRSG
jgi:hypothetical protein